MLGTDQQISQLRENVRRRVDRLRNVGWLALAGLAIAILSIVLGVALPFVYTEQAKSRDAEAQLKAEVQDLRERLQEQKNRIDTLIDQIVAAQRPASSAPVPQKR